MTHNRVEIHPGVYREVLEARIWYGEQSSTAEAGFAEEVEHAIEQIALAPERWPLSLAGTRRFVFRRYPYCLYYRVKDDVVSVVAVAHDKRRAGYWINRLG